MVLLTVLETTRGEIQQVEMRCSPLDLPVIAQNGKVPSLRNYIEAYRTPFVALRNAYSLKIPDPSSNPTPRCNHIRKEHAISSHTLLQVYDICILHVSKRPIRI